MEVTAKARRSGDWWAVEVPEVDGLFTQAKRLEQIPDMVADAVALLEDVPAESVHVRLDPVMDQGTVDALASLSLVRAEADRASRRAALLSRRIASGLRGSGLSYRDIGSIMHISHQRARQLVEG